MCKFSDGQSKRVFKKCIQILLYILYIETIYCKRAAKERSTQLFSISPNLQKI